MADYSLTVYFQTTTPSRKRESGVTRRDGRFRGGDAEQMTRTDAAPTGATGPAPAPCPEDAAHLSRAKTVEA